MCDDKGIINETREGETELKKTDFLKANLNDGNISKLLSRFKDETTREAIKTLREIKLKIKNTLEMKSTLENKRSNIHCERELFKKKFIDGKNRYEKALVENIEGLLKDEELENIKVENSGFENAITRCDDIDRTLVKLLQKNAEGENKIQEILNAGRAHFLKAALRDLSAKIDEPTRKLVHEAWAIRSRIPNARYSKLIQDLFPRAGLEEHTKIWNNFAEKWDLDY